ncbi:MAG: ArsC family (seleno)protein [Planctomycetota bacterium]|nr:ArsC family (seleno)protein [Planctomycetota bacterium]
MAKKIDWYYRRNSCATCTKADEYIASRKLRTKDVVDARKDKLGKREIAQILRRSNRVVAVRGQSILDWDLKRDPPIEKDLYAALLGPQGNLRAPSARVGKTLLVGFTDDAWDRALP